jgi:hypothetical protein
MLRALESEILQQTNASIIEVPDYGREAVLKRARHGMRFDTLRDLLPKRRLEVKADVLWYVLMGPEECELDLFTGWEQVPNKIVYLFDTLPPQFPVVQKLFSDNKFNILVTSFVDAVDPLQTLTGNEWHAIEQAVPVDLFSPVPIEQRSIHFSSYGRRFPAFHEVLLEFCRTKGLYYDFTTHDARHPTAPSEHLYYQYGWHLSHSLFTISWPVELTNPKRAGNLHPVTCRWFEAAAAGTVMLGKQPGNSLFDNHIFKDAVVNIDPFNDKAEILRQLEITWGKREQLFRHAEIMREKNLQRLTWTDRVQRMLALCNAKTPKKSRVKN